MLRIIHVFTIEGHDVVEHALGLDSRTVGVQFNSLYIAIDGFMPLRLFPKGIALLIPFLSGSQL